MAGTINEFSLTDEVKRRLDDLSGEWFDTDTTEVYRGFLLDHVLADEREYEVTKRGTGIFTCSTVESPVALICTDSPQFTAEDGVTYRLYSLGLKIYVTASAATASSISVTGVRVNFREASARLFEYLAGHEAQKISENLSDHSHSPEDVAARLTLMASRIRGPMGI